MVIKNIGLVVVSSVITLLFLLLGDIFFFLSFFIPVVANCVGVPMLFSSKKERAISSAVLTVVSMVLFVLYVLLNYHFGFLDDGGGAAVILFAALITAIPCIFASLFLFFAFKKSEKKQP